MKVAVIFSEGSIFLSSPEKVEDNVRYLKSCGRYIEDAKIVYMNENNHDLAEIIIETRVKGQYDDIDIL